VPPAQKYLTKTQDIFSSNILDFSIELIECDKKLLLCTDRTIDSMHVIRDNLGNGNRFFYCPGNRNRESDTVCCHYSNVSPD
jgi:hypothetical protein